MSFDPPELNQFYPPLWFFGHSTLWMTKKANEKKNCKDCEAWKTKIDVREVTNSKRDFLQWKRRLNNN